MRRLALLAALCLVPCSAAAQHRIEPPAAEPDDEEFARARALFQEGGREVENGRWSDALEAFAASYRLSGIPAALFNAATTLRSMGRHRDSRDLFRQLMEIDDLDDDTRAQAETRLREEAGRVALILVAGLGEMPDAHLELDGRTIEGPREDPHALETDAGRHTVQVSREGFEPQREELTLDDGERATFHVALTEIDTEQFYESPIFWTIVAVVLAGGGVLTGVLLQDQAQLTPRPAFEMNVVRL